MDKTSENNDFQVLMNPNMSNTLSKLQNKIATLETSIELINTNLNKILETSTNIESILQENKKIYISLMKQNQELSQKNLEVLKDNRKVRKPKKIVFDIPFKRTLFLAGLFEISGYSGKASGFFLEGF